MKKKGIILTTVTLVTALLLGTINVSASQTEKNIPEIEQYEKNYDSDLVVHDIVQPEALPAFVAGALTGGAIYDVVKSGVTAFKDAHDKYSGSNVNQQQDGNQQGPWSIEDDYADEFGR